MRKPKAPRRRTKAIGNFISAWAYLFSCAPAKRPGIDRKNESSRSDRLIGYSQSDRSVKHKVLVYPPHVRHRVAPPLWVGHPKRKRSLFCWGVFGSVGAAAWAVWFGVGWCPSGRTISGERSVDEQSEF